MHTAALLLLFWVLAFISLIAAVALLNNYSALIDFELDLLESNKEVVLAAIASLIEAVSLWLIVTYVPTAGRAMIVPALAVGLLYKLGHLADWNTFHIILLLAFQFVILSVGTALFARQFQAAIILLAGFGFLLAIIAAVAKSL